MQFNGYKDCAIRILDTLHTIRTIETRIVKNAIQLDKEGKPFLRVYLPGPSQPIHLLPIIQTNIDALNDEQCTVEVIQSRAFILNA